MLWTPSYSLVSILVNFSFSEGEAGDGFLVAVLLINPLHLMAEVVALTGKGPKPGKVVRGGSKLKMKKIIIYSGKNGQTLFVL